MWNRLIHFFKGCRLELTRLSWVPRSSLVRLTGIVFLVCFLMMVFFGITDFALGQFMHWALS